MVNKKAPMFEQYNSFCSYSISLPAAFSGGLGIEAVSMQKDISVFMKITRPLVKPEYLDNFEIAA